MSATLGVLVPCRNEERVIERKLANLARARWPKSTRPHSLVVIDDGSSDSTARVAREQFARFDPAVVRCVLVSNSARPGKSGAIAQGLRALELEVELALLTDADVAIDPGALVALADAFAADARLGMSCGRQRLVASLADDGTCRGSGGAELSAAQGLYDAWTARVRALESRSGRLVSVHGQLLAWRRSLALAPTPGFAADDLDLMLQARARGVRIALVPQAEFFEVRAPKGEERERQALRRARAYVQFLSHPAIDSLASPGDVASRVQSLFYRRVPTAAPWLAVLCVLGSLALVGRLAGLEAAALLALAWTLFAASSVGRRLFALLRVIASAEKLEAQSALADRWETARE